MVFASWALASCSPAVCVHSHCGMVWHSHKFSFHKTLVNSQSMLGSSPSLSAPPVVSQNVPNVVILQMATGGSGVSLGCVKLGPFLLSCLATPPECSHSWKVVCLSHVCIAEKSIYRTIFSFLFYKQTYFWKNDKDCLLPLEENRCVWVIIWLP